MKIAFLFSLLCLSCALSQGVEYNVSKGAADKKKLEAVFQAVRALEEDPPTREEYEVYRKISSTEYVVWRRIREGKPLTDRYSARGLSLSDEPPVIIYTTRTIRDVSYLLKLKEPIEKADGEIIAGINAQITESTRTLAEGTIRVIEQAALADKVDFTKEKFVEMLKAGKTWTLTDFEKLDCRRCFGDGKLSVTEKEARCPECNGRGGSKVDYVVKW